MDSSTYIYNENIRPIDRIEFSVLGNEEVKKISALGKDSVGIDIPDLYDNMEPKRGGLIDPRMGTTDSNIDCATCGLNSTDCVGHFAHITLSDAVYNLGYIYYVKKILSVICLKCSKLLIDKNEDELTEMLKHKSDKARWNEIRNITSKVNYCKKPGYGCGTPVSKIIIEMKKTTATINIVSEINLSNIQGEDSVQDGRKKIRQIIPPDMCYDILKNVSDTDCKIIGIDPKKTRPEDMILKVFPVPPVAIRPSVKADFLASSTMEDDLTTKLADIIKSNVRIRKNKESLNESSVKYAQDHAHLLQYHVATYLDNDNVCIPRAETRGKCIKALASRFKGKTGRIRGNLMGKRVDFSARTVITPDPGIDINQLGVPLKIAVTLTFPEIVTPYNIDRLQQLVRNGRVKYPGANFVFPVSRFEGGRQTMQIDLRYRKESVDLRYGDVVERHIVDDDFVLLNRQPTLHKLSMMGHRIKVILDESLSTFRMNTYVTTPYNADFDGDEMNIFVPQSEQTRIELSEIADVKRQIISPKNSAPIIGAVQDGVLGAYNLSAPNIRIDWRNAMNIVSYTTIDDFSSIKRDKTSTGSDIFSLIIPSGINTSTAGLEVEHGEIKKGRLSKSHVGGKSDSLIHLIWDEYGMDETKNFLDNVAKLINNFNLYNGFTVGIGDIVVADAIKDQMNKMFEGKKLEIEHIITEMENNPDMIDQDTFETSINSDLNTVCNTVSGLIMNNLDPMNNFNIMITSGSKGGPINMGQMAGCIGQQNVEGTRIKKKVNNRALAYFHQNDDSAGARGFVQNPFLHGATPIEFISHNMGSREGLIDTAIKTAESGYIQRKLIKFLEDITVKYDCTVRTSNDNILQFIYGDDGVDSTKQFSHKLSLIETGDKEIAEKYKFTDQELNQFKDFSNEANDKFYKDLIKLRDVVRKSRMLTAVNNITLNANFMIPVNIKLILNNAKAVKAVKSSNIKLTPTYILEKINSILSNTNTKIVCMSKKEADDSKSIKYKDDQLCKTVFKLALYQFLSPKLVILEHKLDKETFDKMCDRIINNFNKSIVEPGEMVGTIAAQSIGEPTTQMSCHKDTIVAITGKENFYGTISNFIDSMLKENPTRVVTLDNDPNIDSVVMDLDPVVHGDYNVISVSSDEKISWSRISQISRHRSNGDLVKVTTQSGRVTTATLSHSFLKRTSSGKIAPIKGSDLKIGSRIPIAKNVPTVNKPLTTVDGMILNYDFGVQCGSFLSTGKLINDNVKLRQFMKYYFDGKIPTFILASNKQFVNGVIEGYFYNSDAQPFFSVMSLLLLLAGYNVPSFGICSMTDIDKIPEVKSVISRIGKRLKLKEFENFPNKPVNREILKNHITLFENKSKSRRNKMLQEEIKQLKQAVDSDIIWDKIVDLEIIKDPKEYVYDFTVPVNQSFMVDDGIIVHNTLNTFHFAGIGGKGTTSLGVPRIKELIHFSKNMKTPQMKVYLEDKLRQDIVLANKIASYIRPTTISDVRDRVDVYYDPYPQEHGGFMERDNVHNLFYSNKPGKHSCQPTVNGLPWLMRIELNREKMLTNNIRLLDIKSKFCNYWEKRYKDVRGLKKEEKPLLDKITTCAILSNNENDKNPIIHIRFDMTDFNFTTIVNFLDIFIDKFKLKGLDGVEKGLLIESQQRMIRIDPEDKSVSNSTQNVIYISGVNIVDIRYIKGIDLNKTVSNDVVNTYLEYGIEAARALLIKEIQTVYSNDSVNFQHLSVLIDQMMSTGSLISVDRHGMNKLDTDPLSRASFEKTVDQLLQAAVFGETDHMNSVSSRIMAGLAIKGGTGLCNVVIDTDLLENSEYIEDVEHKYKKTFSELGTNSVIQDITSNKETVEGIFMPE